MYALAAKKTNTTHQSIHRQIQIQSTNTDIQIQEVADNDHGNDKAKYNDDDKYNKSINTQTDPNTKTNTNTICKAIN